jgi:senataxin
MFAGIIFRPPGTGKTSTVCALIASFISKCSGKSGPSTGPSKSEVKILLCAPSNAAIDEIAGRLKANHPRSEKDGSKQKVVRVGAQSAISAGVKDVSLDYLVDEKMDSLSKPTDMTDAIATLRKNLQNVKDEKMKKEAELKEVHDNVARQKALDEEIVRLNLKRTGIIQQLDQARDKQKSISRTMDAMRRKARQAVLDGAQIVCSTLSGAGHDILESLDFDLIIIDEAAQAIELSSLIPLRYQCKKCVMVGDPQQLPPTVLSMEVCDVPSCSFLSSLIWSRHANMTIISHFLCEFRSSSRNQCIF